MSDHQTNWDREQLKAYLLIYCANADFSESWEEKEYIQKEISKAEYESIHAEYDGDSDYDRIEKIKSSISRMEYSKEEKDLLMLEVKMLFAYDGVTDVLEENLLRGLKRIIY